MKKLKKSLPPASLVSFRSVGTLRNHLVRAKVYLVGKRLIGSRKCNKNCFQICKNVIEIDTFQSFVDKKFYKINRRFACSDKCLVYLLSHRVCYMQYKSPAYNEF